MLLLFCFLYLVFVLGDFSEGGVGTALASFLSLVAFNCLAVDSSGVVFLTLILLSPLWPFLLRQQPSERSSTNSKNSALRHPSFGGRCRQAMLGVRGLAVQIYKVHVIPPHPAMFEGKADPWRADMQSPHHPASPSNVWRESWPLAGRYTKSTSSRLTQQCLKGKLTPGGQICKVHIIPPHPAMFEGKADPWRADIQSPRHPASPSNVWRESWPLAGRYAKSTSSRLTQQCLKGKLTPGGQICKVHIIPPHPAMFEGKADPWRADIQSPRHPASPSNVWRESWPLAGSCPAHIRAKAAFAEPLSSGAVSTS